MPPQQSAVKQAAQNIVEYHDGLTEITDNIQDIRDRAGGVVDDLSVVRRALDKIDSIASLVSDFGDDVDKLKLVFNLMGKAGPLKGIAKIGTDMLNRVEAVVDKVEDKIDAVAQKITDSKINQKLETAITKVEEVDGKLASGQSKVIGQRDSFEGVANIAAKAYVFAEEPILALGTVMDAPAAAVTRINNAYDDIVGAVNQFNTDLPSADFNALLEIETGIARVSGVLASIRAPLDVVFGALKPIEPILNAVGLISKFTVDPVIDFLLNTLGIDNVINAASDKITAFLPDVDVLDVLLDSIDDAIPSLDGILTNFGNYDDDGDEAVDAEGTPQGDDVPNPQTGALPTPRIADPFGIGQWIVDEIEAQLIQTATEVRDGVTDEVLGYVRERIGSLDAQGLAVFVEIPAPLLGSDDDDDLSADVAGIPVENVILVGDDRSNRITAFDGDNMLYGAGGDDTLVGEGVGSTGAGLDTAVFTGPLGQYVFSWADLDDATSDLTVEHVSPLAGVSFDGTDLLQDIERVTFLGTPVVVDGVDQALTLTVQELRDSVSTVDTDFTAPSGSDDDLYVFANYTQSSGRGVSITGSDGDDLLVGGQARDTINGGLGNDTIQIGGPFSDLDNRNVVDGGGGRDLYTLQPGWTTAHIDLEERQAFSSGTGEDENFVSATLFNIENVSADVARRAFIYGDGLLLGNVLTGGAARDAIHGRGGADTLLGAEGDDTLVGGLDIDTLDGGAGDDHLVATDRALGWMPGTDPVTGEPMGERIIGGAGYDRAYYSTILDDVGQNVGGNGEPFSAYIGPFNAGRWGAFYSSEREEMQQAIVSIGWVETRLREATATEDAVVEVRRMSDRDANGLASLLAVDTLDGVEEIIGTNNADVLYGLTGDAAFDGLFGAGGDDTLHAQEASGYISGDGGRDTVIASARLLPQVSGDEEVQPPPARFYVGDEFDTLDLSQTEGLRWSVWEENRPDEARKTYVQASDARDGQALSANFGVSNYAIDEYVGFGTIVLSENADVVDIVGFSDEFSTNLPPFDLTLRGGDGNDSMEVQGSNEGAIVTALGEAGDDTIKAFGGVFADGGIGDDSLEGQNANNTLMGGAGDDTISLRPDFSSSADGGEGIDLLILPSDGRVRADLAEGTVSWEVSSATVSAFEAVAGGDEPDLIRGSERDDKFAGVQGEDTLWGGDINGPLAGGSNPGPETARIGTYLQFDGDHETALSGSITFEVLISTVSDVVDFQRMIMAPSGTGQQRLSLALKDGEAHLRGDMEGGGFVFIQSGYIADGAEHQIVGSYDAITSTMQLWVDGVLEGTASVPRALRPADQDILIGTAGAVQFIDAELPRVRVWSEVLEPAAITNGAPAPYLDVEATGDRRDLLAPGAEITQRGILAEPFTIEGKTTGQDALYGGAHADSINGGDDDDFLHPGGGGRQFGTLTDPDTVEGGRGRDTASFAFAGLDNLMRANVDERVIEEGFEAAHVDLAAGRQWALGSGTLRTVLSSIENVIGTHLDDSIAGNRVSNVLTGGEGGDTILGLGGDDVIAALGADLIEGGDGDDTIGVGLADATIHGGTGVDVLVFSGDDTIEDADGNPAQANGYSYDLLDGTYSGRVSEGRPIWAEVYTGGTDSEARSNGSEDLTPLQVWRADPEEARSVADTQRDVPVYDRDQDREGDALNPTDFRISFVDVQSDVAGELSGINVVRGASGSGSNEADALTGSIFDDRIAGRDGDDTLAGLAGEDRLLGGAGADSLQGGADNDTLIGQEGRDTLEGGADADVVNGGEGNDRLLGGAGRDLLSGGPQNDDISGQGEADTVLGGDGNDTLNGGDGADSLVGAAGSDELRGGNQDDTLIGNNGNDTLFGGAGHDHLDGGANGDTLQGNGGVDLLDGGAGADQLNGGDGDDTVLGKAGADTLIGGNGSDNLRGGNDYDAIDGGRANDTLSGGSGRDTLEGGAGADEVNGGAGNDVLTGDAGADRLTGGGQNDDLSGQGGDDTLLGGNGDDTLIGGSDADSLNGAKGRDELRGGTGNDTVIGGNGSDTLFGGDGADSLWGGDSNDTLYGNQGRDTLEGGNGADELNGGDSDDRLLGGRGDDTLDGDAQNDDLSGETGDDTVLGGNGDDTLSGGTGADSLNGGAGHDELRGGEDGDAIEGADGRDTLYGEAGADRLLGGNNDDTLFGNDGDDTLEGGEGSDSLSGGAQDDDLVGNGGDDTLIGGRGNDTLNGGRGADSLFGGSGADELRGGIEGDTLIGNDGSDSLFGGAGSDVMKGGDDNDTLFGNEGDDTLEGAAGADALIGGDDRDTFLFKTVAGIGSVNGAASDEILDFIQGEDVIDLSEIDAQIGTEPDNAFDFIGTATHTGAGATLRYVISASSKTFVYGDVDGDGGGDFALILDGPYALTAGDFIL